MPTKTFGLHQVEQVDKNSSVNRVPLEALQMLTQSVSKCNQDYIQPLPLKVHIPIVQVCVLRVNSVRILHSLIQSC